ncbi:hypothetical protein [Undibacterium sp. Ji22W]|uniref:hypothetical protein n=1 Tax=Undibacterium sp. Ji22W TaxID=3413038 RepID=UPI003BF30950
MLKIISSMILCVCCALSFNAVASDTPEDQALDLLIARIEGTSFYKTRQKLECLRFTKTHETRVYFDFKIYENHNGKNCPGDVGVAPTVDTFRVLKKSKKIMLYQVTKNKFVLFDDAIAKK